MKILHVIDSLARGGAERMLVGIANASVEFGHVVGACVTRDDVTLATDLHPSIELYCLGRKRRFDLRGAWRFRRVLGDFHPDVIQAHSRSTIAFLLSCGPFRQPVVLQDHFGSILVDSRVPWWFKPIGRLRVAAHVGVSEDLRRWAQNAGIADERSFVIGNAMDLEPFLGAGGDPTEGTHPSKTRMGVAVAGWRREKGLHVLVEALASVKTEIPWKLMVVGTAANLDYVTECRGRAEQAGVADRLDFVGGRSDVPSLLAEADFGVVPSVSESGPLVLIEFLASGLPFAATLVGNVASRAAAAGGAEFVQPGNALELASAVKRLLELPDQELEARGAAGRVIAKEHFDIRRAMPQWNDVYQMVTSRRFP